MKLEAPHSRPVTVVISSAQGITVRARGTLGSAHLQWSVRLQGAAFDSVGAEPIEREGDTWAWGWTSKAAKALLAAVALECT